MYARINNGIVAELFTPPSGFTLAECFHPALAAQFVAVPSGVSPSEGWLYSDGTFSEPAAPPAPSAAQIAAEAYAALIVGGITITSGETPALNGVYPIDPESQANIAVEAQFISTFNEFTNGTTVGLQWQQMSGAWVSFPTTMEFLAFAKVIGQLVAVAKLAAAQGNSMPSAVATIP